MEIICLPCIIIIRNTDSVYKRLAYSECFIKVACVLSGKDLDVPAGNNFTNLGTATIMTTMETIAGDRITGARQYYQHYTLPRFLRKPVWLPSYLFLTPLEESTHLTQNAQSVRSFKEGSMGR